MSAQGDRFSQPVRGTTCPRLESHLGRQSYIHDFHCAFYGLCEHKVELFHGILKGLFISSIHKKANERGTEESREIRLFMQQFGLQHQGGIRLGVSDF